LDADEAVVLGAGLFAANLSTTFRLRKFGMTDGATYPIQFQVSASAHSCTSAHYSFLFAGIGGFTSLTAMTSLSSGLAVQLDREGTTGDLEEEAFQPKALLPFMKKVPAKRVVHLPDHARDPVSFTLSYNTSRTLPAGVASPVLAAFEVTGALPEAS
jgi:hypoxia up-regulated 1